jgi:hypothetical protein
MLKTTPLHPHVVSNDDSKVIPKKDSLEEIVSAVETDDTAAAQQDQILTPEDINTTIIYTEIPFPQNNADIPPDSMIKMMDVENKKFIEENGRGMNYDELRQRWEKATAI